MLNEAWWGKIQHRSRGVLDWVHERLVHGPSDRRGSGALAGSPGKVTG
ncbi:hypothetical protein WCLP8_3010006 [uncultured Gammaproteobacteria bacterium]